MATYDGKADFAKVDIDQLADLSFDYNASGFGNIFILSLQLKRS
jgi:hypothetical protein